jgi:branched-chain amino acid transport system permease protein
MVTVEQEFTAQTWKSPLTRFGPYIITGIIFLIIPALLPSYVQSIMTKVLIFALFAMSLNIIFGYTGLLSLGHAAFFGTGGYTIAILIIRYGFESFWIAMPAAIVVTVIVAAVLGVIALRVSHIYFLLVTFALSMLLVSIANKWYSMTNGVNGICGIPPPDLGFSWLIWNSANFYYFVFIFFAICFFLIRLVINSPLGLSLQGIRENEDRMCAMGYNIWLYKYIAFIIGALFAGVAGVLFTYHNAVISPFHIGLTMSALAMLICIMGGLGTLWGPLIGALVIILIEYFSSLYIPARWPLVLGGIFIISVMLIPEGIVPYLRRLWKRLLYGSVKS